MSRLVNVSNRVILPRAVASAGGLAVGINAAMRESGGLWFGWSGRTVAGAVQTPSARVVRRGSSTYATIDLPRKPFDLYYNGFANGTLWPLLHTFLDRFRFRHEEHEAYLEVNRLFALALLPLLQPGDAIWVHDYHLMPLAAQLRALGVHSAIGFFLHVPFPGFDVWRALPAHASLLRALLACDVLGFQTEPDRVAFVEAVRAALPQCRISGAGSIEVAGRTVLAGVYPIGIDPAAVQAEAAKAAGGGQVHDAGLGLQGRRLIIGVDRIDYSKGLLQRFEAYQHFLETAPQYRSAVTYLQLAQLGRQRVHAYSSMRRALERSAGSINGRFAEVDWTPIRYVNRPFPHETVMGLLRLARVCLVTPLRDGMNLVAKEFIAAQDPSDPGVLVLSDRAGAARELRDALLVNPYDILAIAQALRQALDMPLAQRRARHARLLQALHRHDIRLWQTRFVASLRASQDGQEATGQPLLFAATLPPTQRTG
ncbi:MAG: trehalose-6-phosphate synthase [Proteobacteria bacterium]|nr:trehalose-6-phosphate synthase [Pseudomonadota bacterium]